MLSFIITTHEVCYLERYGLMANSHDSLVALYTLYKSMIREIRIWMVYMKKIVVCFINLLDSSWLEKKTRYDINLKCASVWRGADNSWLSCLCYMCYIVYIEKFNRMVQVGHHLPLWLLNYFYWLEISRCALNKVLLPCSFRHPNQANSTSTTNSRTLLFKTVSLWQWGVYSQGS